MLSVESLSKFKNLYKETFGIELEDDACQQKARALVELYVSVYDAPYEARSAAYINQN